MITWSTEKRKLSELKPAEYNPRMASEKEAKNLSQSIEKFNLADPIIINANNVIIGGHFRYKILKEKYGCNGYEIDVRVPNRKLTDAEERELNLRLNKNNGEWDFDMLANFDENLLKNIGFESIELDKIFQLNLKPEDDDAPPLPKKAISKIGDIYQLGKHRLLCGDATKRENVERLMDGEKVDMVFTDPPYDMQMGGQGCWAKSTKNIKKRIDNIINFDAKVLAFLPSLKIPSYYIFTSKNAIPDYLNIFKEYNFNILVWCKTNPTPFTSGSFLPDVEYLMFFSEKGNKIWNNSLKPTDVYKKYYIGSKLEGREDEGAIHPTMKPIRIISDKLRISSNEKGIVLDLFLGSGSTLIACEKTNRICYGCELDEKYCDVVIKRWEDFTGNKAIKL